MRGCRVSGAFSTGPTSLKGFSMNPRPSARPGVQAEAPASRGPGCRTRQGSEAGRKPVRSAPGAEPQASFSRRIAEGHRDNGPLARVLRFDLQDIPMSIDPAAPALFKAAQYLRMSTENQRYSLGAQAEAIADYARTRGLEVVRIGGGDVVEDRHAERPRRPEAGQGDVGLLDLLDDIVGKHAGLRFAP
ncbi:MAG TPA: recombinase family protein [Caulobacter sp.]|nr:recombinase family protein [Caulobacter sp.]